MPTCADVIIRKVAAGMVRAAGPDGAIVPERAVDAGIRQARGSDRPFQRNQGTEVIREAVPSRVPLNPLMMKF